MTDQTAADSPLHGHASSRAKLLIFTVFILIALTTSCVAYFILSDFCQCFCWWLRRRLIGRGQAGNGYSGSRGATPAADTRRVHELSTVLPVFEYSSTIHDQDNNLGCAVCLGDFADGEKVRQLPSCGHDFHVECIDMWLHSQSTCPLCRAIVDPKAPELPAV